ncbi:MAG: ZIP family metal transporter [Candidatus Aenigmatarchaeota archaeon]
MINFSIQNINMLVLLQILLTTFLVSLISFIGILTLLTKKKLMEKILLGLVALSAGALLGSSFFHLLVEASEFLSYREISFFTLIGFLILFFVEKIIHWHHCHIAKCRVHTFGYINLIGDGVHNFIDGLAIAASFLSSFKLGITTTIAVILHEIPQEIGDFGVLVYAGFKRKKALLFNFISALIAVFGGLVGYFIPSDYVLKILLPFAAGNFIYVAASDLIPEIKKEVELKRSSAEFIVLLLGILLMYTLTFIS